MKEQDKRSLALVLAGAFFGFIPTILSASWPAWSVTGSILLLVVFIVLALLYGTGILQDYCHRQRLSARWKAALKLGILNDSGWNPANIETYTWTDVHPNHWKSQLELSAQTHALKLETKSIQVLSQFDSYAIILNPYGGVYPEQDYTNLTSLRKIIEFVREGGLFVNVADIPSYWAYNQDLGRKLDMPQTVYGTVQDGTDIRIFHTKPFELTPLAKELGLRIVGLNRPINISLDGVLGRIGCTIVARRAVIVESKVKSCVSTFSLPYPYDGKSYDMTPIFFLKYGKGEFLVSLPWINDETHNESQKQWLRDAICEFTVQRAVQMKGTT